MSNYIDELGIGSVDATPSDAETENTEDFVQVSNTEETIEDTKEDTEPNISEELKKQIEGLEKRISDKDEYINLLREQSKKQEAEFSETEEVDTSDVDFWDDPEATIKSLKETLRIQQMQTQEIVYANTVDNYWETVNSDALKSAVATDADFANEFNKSNQPYKVAYEYLKKKTETVKASEQSLREQIKAELLKEMGMDKPKKEAPPSMGSMGGSSGKRTDIPDDGFAAVFGSKR